MPILSKDALKQPWARRWGAEGALLRAVCLCLAVYLMVSSCLAQESPRDGSSTGGKTPEAQGSANAIQYVGPETYILLDAEGRPQAMPGMTYEDFMAAWKQLQQAATHERQARFAIDNVAIDGKATGDRAELRFEATVRLLSEEPVEVPLGLVGAILRDQPQFGPAAESEKDKSRLEERSQVAEAAGEEYVDFNPERGGFVAHFAGRPGERRTVSLNVLAPLLRNGAETTLALNCPRALAATLALDVDAAVTEATVSSGALLSREPVAGGGTRLTAAGLAGQFRMAWSTAEVAAAELSTVLSATGAIQVTIDGRSVRTEARLTVRSYGGSFDRFRVRLPQGARLMPNRADASEKEPDYRITVEDDITGNNSGPATGRQVAVVQLPTKLQGPVEVEFATEQPLNLSDSNVAVQLAGFDVLGAVRQFGDVALRVADDWQVRWDAGQYVRQIDTNELEGAMQGPGLTGAFQYDQQPWSLGLQVSARDIRVQVTPVYELDLLPDEARLRVHLTYQVLGARAHEFRVDLRGWERTADAIESGGLVDRDRIQVTDDGVLVLPLTQTSLRRAELTFFVRRAVPRDVRQINLPLPVPMAESVATGDLLVRAAPGIELMPAGDRSEGLTATPVMTDSRADDDDRSEFHFRSVLPQAIFSADRVNRARDVAINVATQIDLRPEWEAQVRERVEYVVRFEPMAELVFGMPGELKLEDGEVEVVLLSRASDGSGDERVETPLSFAAVSENGEAIGGSQDQQVRVTLPQPRMGRFAVELRYKVNRPPSPSSSWNWALPLARPDDGRVGEWRATVRTPRNLGVSLDPAIEAGEWKEVETDRESAGRGPGKEFLATRPQEALPLVVHAVDVDLPSATMVERAWLQTWLTGSVRQDRAAFRFRTAGRVVTVELWPDISAEEVEVLLDGQPAEVISRDAGRISVHLAPPSDDHDVESDLLGAMRPHTLELRYRWVSNDRLLTRRRLTPPQMVGMKALADVYWQIVLPGDRHVIESPPQLAAASQWQWLGTFWGRRPTRSQAELEQWVGASTQPAPTAAQNEYLYSGLAPASSIEVVTAPRWFIVLVSSGSVLALALAWIYVAAVRRRWVVAAVACLLAALAVAYPTPAMLISQASMLGVALAALAAFIARLVARPTQWYLPVSGGSSHRHLTPQLTPRAESVMIGPFASAVASTAPTASLPVSESKS